MNKKRMLMKIASFALCAALALNACSAFSPTYAAVASPYAYTFGDVNGPFRDLAKEHEEEMKQRDKKRKKEEQKQAMLEKAAMKKAAREARERERREKAAKETAEKASDQSAA